MQIHVYAEQGNLEGVARLLSEGVPVDSRRRADAYTPLMCAVVSPEAGLDLIRFLLEKGADLNAVSKEQRYNYDAILEFDGEGERPEPILEESEGETVLGLAIHNSTLDKIQLLLDAGADIHYVRRAGYDALIDAMFNRVVSTPEERLALLKLLVAYGAPLRGESDYCESPLRISSRQGQFEVVRFLLEAGGDPDHLKWTPLHSAVALGTLEDVERELAAGGDLHARDWWERTPWLLSLQTGDINKAKRLLEAGANRDDRGRCGKTALMHAIENEQAEVLSWLLEQGVDVNGRNDHAHTALMEAASDGATECVRRLLQAGARAYLTDARPETFREMFASSDLEYLIEEDAEAGYLDEAPPGQKAIDKAANMDIVRLLMAEGEDIAEMNAEVRAMFLRLDTEGEVRCSREEYEAAKRRRFGTANPEKMDLPFWKAMVRSGASAWRARDTFSDTDNLREGAVWSYSRFGKSITELPDGRIIEVGGEHEDSYDPDFCIYNEVFVHDGQGKFDIYGYPEAVFPPTDFHSATLVGEFIYIIGSLGYYPQRQVDETPVYRLHCQTLAIEKVETSGDKPGWISRHRARYDGAKGEIEVWGGMVWALFEDAPVEGEEENKDSADNGRSDSEAGAYEDYGDNTDRYVLDLASLKWRLVAE